MNKCLSKGGPNKTLRIVQAIVIHILIIGICQATLFSNVKDTLYLENDVGPISMTRTTYELKIEVDYFEGLLRPDVVEGFEFLVSYFENRGIPTEVDFNSTNNIVEGSGYIRGDDMRDINRQYHDQSTTHIYFLVARVADGNAGSAYPLWGAAIGLEMAENRNYDVRFLIMHEFGHCIGIGLQDDTDEYNETYSTSGFMGLYYPNIIEYNEDDWNASFAPDGTFGNQTRKQARMWNRYSIIGEIYDDTSDVMGNVGGDIVSNGPVIILREVNGTNEYATNVYPPDGAYIFHAKPGFYTLEALDGFELDKRVFVNITEREIVYIENVTIERSDESFIDTSQNDYVLLALTVTISITTVLVVALIIKRRKLST